MACYNRSMKDMSKLWTEEDARAFLGLRIKKKYKENGKKPKLINGIPIEMPESLMSIRLESEKVREALQACASAEEGDIVLVTGPGGSGKSAIYRAVAHSVDNALCITPTGIAAYNLEWNGWNDELSTEDYKIGTPKTINKAFSLPVKDYYRVKDADKNAASEEGISHIMVDEISMVNPNVLDLLIYKARKLGVPLLLFGDPLQLPPVEKDIYESPLAMYSTWRFFGSFGWMLQREDKLKCVILDSVFRQNDPEFKGLLNRARIQELTEHDKEVLKSRVTTEEISQDTVVLCSRNETVQKINNKMAPKSRLSLSCDTVYKKIFGEKPFGDMVDVEWKKGLLKTKEDRSNELVVLSPRKFSDPDVFNWEVDDEYVDMDTSDFEKKQNVHKILKLYPGNRVMITRNTYVYYVPDDFAYNLNRYIKKGGNAKCSFPIDLDEKENRMQVVNGHMGTYMGVANGFVNGRWVRYFFEDDCIPFDDYDAKRKDKFILNNNSDEFLVIRLDTGKLILLSRFPYKETKTDNKGEKEIKGTIYQFPVKHAFAITYHKSQGLTLDKVHMILEPDEPIPPGLGYLGLSRCRTLEGLTLSYFDEKAFKCDRLSKDFMKRLELMTNLPSFEERRHLVALVREDYEEMEPEYRIEENNERFFSVKKAMESLSISETDDATKRKGVLWELNRQKLHLHPELSRLLHLSGEPGGGRRKMAEKIVKDIDEDALESMVSFMSLKNPKPGDRDYLDREEYDERSCSLYSEF